MLSVFRWQKWTMRTSLWWTWCDLAAGTETARHRECQGSSSVDASSPAAAQSPVSRGWRRTDPRRLDASSAANNSDLNLLLPRLCASRGDTAPTNHHHTYTYCTVTYWSTHNKLQQVTNVSFTRSWSDVCTTPCHNLHWLDVSDRIKYRQCVHVSLVFNAYSRHSLEL